MVDPFGKKRIAELEKELAACKKQRDDLYEKNVDPYVRGYMKTVGEYQLLIAVIRNSIGEEKYRELYEYYQTLLRINECD